MQTRGLCAKSGQLTADFYGQKTAVRAVFGDFADVSRWCSRQTCGPTPDGGQTCGPTPDGISTVGKEAWQ